MTTFLLEIITPEREAFSQEVEAVVVPTDAGQIGILTGHEPLFCTLTEGMVKISQTGKEFLLAIGGGFLQVLKDKTLLLVSRAVNADQINEAEIKKAQEQAKEALKRKVTGDELVAARAMLRRSMAEFKVLRHRQRQRQNI